MTVTRAIRLAAGALVSVLAAAGLVACGSRPVAPRPYPPDQLVIRVSIEGGLMPIPDRLTELPVVSVYGDGRVITPGPVPTIYPGPALRTLLIRHIGAAGVDAMVRQAMAAGVGSTLDLGTPNVADAPSTRIVVRTGKGDLVTEAAALGFSDGGELTQVQRAARAGLQHLVDTWTERTATDDAQPYRPTGVAAISMAWTDGATPGVPPPAELVWPGPPLPGAQIDTGSGVGCVDVSGDLAGPVLAAAASASTITPWTSGGSRWTVAFRPLLPDESGCASLGR